jgi:hypothetical protein
VFNSLLPSIVPALRAVNTRSENAGGQLESVHVWKGLSGGERHPAGWQVTTKEGKNFTVPKGDIVATSPTFAHRLQHVFKDADTYDPFRFTGDRKEDKAQPFSYIGALAAAHTVKRTARCGERSTATVDVAG